MKWDSNLYDDAQNYVSEYGKELLSFIPNSTEQRILDLGCGTGDLTAEIFKKNKNIIGTDYSEDMIAHAKNKYPYIQFFEIDACSMTFVNEFDIIFSNAVLHWINNQKKVHKNIFTALKDSGIFICEFGAKNNIKNIYDAYNESLEQFDSYFKLPFYFPSPEQHIPILEENGFIVKKIYDFERPTVLPNKENGLRQWVSQFFSSDLKKYSLQQQELIFQSMEKTLKSKFFNGKNWVADYRRIRVIAHKESYSI